MFTETRAFPPALRAALRHEVLTPDREREIALRVKRDRAAYESLFCSNLRLVIWIAMRFKNRGVPLEDLFQHGCLGLDRAIRKFDARRGFRFSTYAAPWIRNMIARAILNTRDLIRLPIHAHEQQNRMLRAEEQYLNRFGQEPSVAYLARAAGVAESTATLLLDDYRVKNLELVEAAAEIPAPTYKPPRPAFIRDAAATAAALGLIADLPPREREVLLLRLRGWHLTEVGRRFGLCRERIRQIQDSIFTLVADPARKVRAPGATETAYLMKCIRVAARARKNERVLANSFRVWITRTEGWLPASDHRSRSARGFAHRLSRKAWIANRRRLGLRDNGLLPALIRLREKKLPRLANIPEFHAAILELASLVRSPRADFFYPHRGFLVGTRASPCRMLARGPAAVFPRRCSRTSTSLLALRVVGGPPHHVTPRSPNNRNGCVESRISHGNIDNDLKCRSSRGVVRKGGPQNARSREEETC